MASKGILANLQAGSNKQATPGGDGQQPSTLLAGK
jgi:hypothetical protein